MTPQVTLLRMPSLPQLNPEKALTKALDLSEVEEAETLKEAQAAIPVIRRRLEDAEKSLCRHEHLVLDVDQHRTFCWDCAMEWKECK